MILSRYEWTAGPELIYAHERTEFHAGKGVLEPKGERFRILAGQVRDTRLGIILNWAIRAPRNRVNANLALAELKTKLSRSSDWSPRVKKRAADVPKGWTLPEAGAEFEQGLIV